MFKYLNHFPVQGQWTKGGHEHNAYTEATWRAPVICPG